MHHTTIGFNGLPFGEEMRLISLRIRRQVDDFSPLRTIRENADVERQRRILLKLGFELEPPRLDPSEAISIMHRDKKVEEGTIRFVLPRGIGSHPIVRAVPERLISQVLEDEGYG